MIKKMKNDLDKKILICGKDFFVASCSANLYIGVASVLNQGTSENALSSFSVAFFGSFLARQKRTIEFFIIR